MQDGPAEDDSKAAEPRARFLTVGVGASAGGLAATVSLLKALPAMPGFAMVVVHHLDPRHESNLVEVLAKNTEMRVLAAVQGMLVEPNTVYAGPSNAELVVAGGALQLTPRAEGFHLPIDRLFESLAEDATSNAAAVLLTGTGQDGSEGVRAIKIAGGVTFAQDASAPYRAMPESAIATGCVDHVMAPAAIAAELMRLARLGRSEPDSQSDAPDFERVLIALQTASTIDFANYKQSTVRRRIQRRIHHRRLSTMGEYADFVEQHPEEATALAEEVLIHVTSFFRDPEVFAALKTLVFPNLVEQRLREAPIRVWVPGCSSGEELYSIAISLIEFLAERDLGDVQIKLFGTDVSAAAIDRARAGLYQSDIEHEVSPARLQRFFTKLEGAYRIRKDVRDICVFAKHDVARDAPFARVDLISCRNLMIYLGTALQDRVVPTFHYALNDVGFLLLGSSETVRAFPGFETIDPKSKLFSRTSAAPRFPFAFASPMQRVLTPQDLAAVEKSNGARDVYREADRLVLEGFAPPGVLITDEMAIAQFRGETGPYLAPTPGLATFDLMRMLHESLRLVVRRTIDEARLRGAATRSEPVVALVAAEKRSIQIEVLPFAIATSPQRFFVVLFKEATAPRSIEAPAPRSDPNVVVDPAAAQLMQELASTRSYLQSTIEQLEASNEELRAANEEIVSSNEELRSTNEELQMAKEELEASNEELRTVNDEMGVRNSESTRLSDDLANLLNSAEIPILILGRDNRIRRYTPAAARWLRLTASDIGRAIGDIHSYLLDPAVLQLIPEVLEHLTVAQHTAQDENGRWFQLIVRPYMTLDNRIDGTVLYALDIDGTKKGELLLQEARIYAESIVDTIRECLVVVDADLRVSSANRAFLAMFHVSGSQIAGNHLREIDGGTFDNQALLDSLGRLTKDGKLHGARVTRENGKGAKRVFELNARRIEGSSKIVVALNDITDALSLSAELELTAAGYREMLANAAEAIVMADRKGTILFANLSATKLFGYEGQDMRELSVGDLVPARLRPQLEAERLGYLSAPAAGSMGKSRELYAAHVDGHEFPIEMVIGSMRRGDGCVSVSFITDISERRATEQQIVTYQDKLQQMAFDSAIAEEHERRRIAIDLHDRIGQSLALAQIKLSSARDSIASPWREAISDSIELVSKSITDTRTLTFELSPPVLYDLGLKDALLWLIEDIEKRHGLQIELVDDSGGNLVDGIQAALVFRAVRELLMNIFKHAHSRAAKVSLRSEGTTLVIEVQDRGVGFDPDHAASRHHGFGLFSVREQIHRLGGTLEVKSERERGTSVTIYLPVTGVQPPAIAPARGAS